MQMAVMEVISPKWKPISNNIKLVVSKRESVRNPEIQFEDRNDKHIEKVFLQLVLGRTTSEFTEQSVYKER